MVVARSIRSVDDVNTPEAIGICEEWFAFNDRQRAKSKRIAELAAIARTGPEGHEKAKRELRQIDASPVVFGGDRLEPAVKHLIKTLRATTRELTGDSNVQP